jgi:N-acetylmuramoyl-L-alanine amidase
MIRNEPEVYAKIDAWLPTVYLGSDPSGGADYYINPEIEGYPTWTTGCYRLQKIGNHQFYRGK